MSITQFASVSYTEGNDLPATSATSAALRLGAVAHGNISGSSDQDWYKVELTAGVTYSFGLVGIGSDPLADPFLSVYRANGTILVAQDDNSFSGTNAGLTFTAPVSGTYYLAAKDAGGKTGSYGIAATQGTKVSADAQMLAGVDSYETSWADVQKVPAGTTTTVTVGFRSTSDGSVQNFSRFGAAQKAEALSQLNFVSEVANIAFNAINPTGYTNDATILMANYYVAGNGVAGYGTLPTPLAVGGDLWINDNTGTSIAAIQHEIGHALGLTHPGNYAITSGVFGDYQNGAQIVQDTELFSISSYFSADDAGVNAPTPQTYMIADILAFQNEYGINTTTRTGNTTYGFNSNAGDLYNFAKNTAPSLTIWDAGGTDTLDASGFFNEQVLNLGTMGTLSSIGGYTANVGIAYGALIEHAKGGLGQDIIRGNYANNRLSGLDGDDKLYGYAGRDTLTGGDGADRLFGGNGNDLLVAGGQTNGLNTGPIGMLSMDRTQNSSLSGSGLTLAGSDGSFTLEYLWQQSALPDSAYTINFGNLGIYRNATGWMGLSFSGADGETWQFIGYEQTLLDGDLHRFTIRYNEGSGQLSLFLDGRVYFEQSYTAGSRNVSATGNLWMSDSATIGDIRIWHGARSDAQIFETAFNPLTTAQQTSDLAHYWQVSGTNGTIQTVKGSAALSTSGPTSGTFDSFWSDSSQDRMAGNGGNDRYRIDSSNDLVFEKANQGFDTLEADVDYTLRHYAHVERLIATGDGITLRGNNRANTLISQDGDDILVGRGGNDTFIVNSAADQMREAENGGFDTLKTSVDYVLRGGVHIERLVITGTSGVTLRDNNMSSTLISGAGDDRMAGFGGDDRLVAGAGQDTLWGGKGADTFVFNVAPLSDGLDRIMDFSAAQGDKIELSASVIGLSVAAGQLGAALFAGAASAVTAATRIYTDSGVLYADTDGNGAGDATALVQIGNTAISAENIWIV